MDRHTLESIRRIKEASKNGKLVMFIGAGVSALSGYPNWGRYQRAFCTVSGRQ